MQNDAEGQEIAPKGTPPAGGLGVGMMRQRVPFHRSMRALFELEPPAAKHAEDVGHDTPLKLPPPVGLGVAWIDQLVPFQRSASVKDPLWLGP
jgi:hypothetical protein